MKKVLIITYYWPPGSSPGVQRWLKFVKFLSAYGWSPVVLTVKNGSFPNTDASLETDIPQDVTVYRASTFEPFRLYNALRGKSGKAVEVGMSNIDENKGILSKAANYIRSNIFIPDARAGWNMFAVKKALKIIKTEQIDLVLTTGPPHSTHLQGLTIKRKTGLPWIADFRDPWTNIYYNRFLKRSQKSIEKDQAYEDMVLKSVDGLVVVSEGMKREFNDRMKEIRVIFNGYDPEDFADLVRTKNRHFTLAYIGNFKSTQDVASFWESINELNIEVPGFRDRFRFEITGNVADNLQMRVQQLGLAGQVTTQHFVRHKQAVQIMQQADMLYLPVPNIPGNKSIVTGKIFEYLASRTPIIAIGPRDGDAALVLESAKRTPIHGYEEKDKIKTQIYSGYKRWESMEGDSEPIMDTGHEIYTRQALCGKMASFFDQICQSDQDEQ